MEDLVEILLTAPAVMIEQVGAPPACPRGCPARLWARLLRGDKAAATRVARRMDRGRVEWKLRPKFRALKTPARRP